MTVVKSRVVVQVSRTNWRESKQGGVVVLSDTGGQIITQADETDLSYNNVKGDTRDASTENDVITDPDDVACEKNQSVNVIQQFISVQLYCKVGANDSFATASTCNYSLS